MNFLISALGESDVCQFPAFRGISDIKSQNFLQPWRNSAQFQIYRSHIIVWCSQITQKFMKKGVCRGYLLLKMPQVKSLWGRIEFFYFGNWPWMALWYWTPSIFTITKASDLKLTREEHNKSHEILIVLMYFDEVIKDKTIQKQENYSYFYNNSMLGKTLSVGSFGLGKGKLFWIMCLPDGVLSNHSCLWTASAGPSVFKCLRDSLLVFYEPLHKVESQ